MDGGLKITVILGQCVGVGEYLYYDALADVQSVKCFLFISGSYIQKLAITSSSQDDESQMKQWEILSLYQKKSTNVYLIAFSILHSQDINESFEMGMVFIF